MDGPLQEPAGEAQCLASQMSGFVRPEVRVSLLTPHSSQVGKCGSLTITCHAGPGAAAATCRRSRNAAAAPGSPGLLRIRWISVAVQGEPAYPDSSPTRSLTSAGSRQRARVRCGRNRRPSSGGGAPARREPAATDLASASRTRRSPWEPGPQNPGAGRAGEGPAARQRQGHTGVPGQQRAPAAARARPPCPRRPRRGRRA